MRPLLSPVQCRPVAFREADTVLVIGARANSMLSLFAPAALCDAGFINVNIDGREIGHHRDVELGIIGNAKLALLPRLRSGCSAPKERRPGSRSCRPSSAPTRSANRRCCIPAPCRFIR
jgi:thiamine pyrophosphate-dependent acetolactate synthase large subunit-like protein